MFGKKEPSEKALARQERDRQMDARLEAEFYDPEKRKRRRRNVRRGFLVCLLILIVATVINWGVVTNWGSIQVDRITLTGDEGEEYSALVYKPSSATSDDPAPAVLMIHGASGSARSHEAWAIEFARRGCVAISLDMYGRGDSMGNYVPGVPPYKNLNEVDLFYAYMEELPYVDSGNIIVSGHSIGSSIAVAVGAQHDSKGVLAASGSPTVLYKKYQDIMDDIYAYDGNIVFLYGTAEMGNTPEEHAAGVEAQDLLPIFQAHTGDSSLDTVEVDKVYGSFEEGNAIVLSLEQRIHEAVFVNSDCISHLLEYGQAMLGDAVPNYLDPDDQVWQVKDFTGLFGIFAFAAFLCSLTLLLIEEVPVFAGAKRPLPRNVGMRGGALAFGLVLGFFLPYLVCKTDAFGIVGGGQSKNLTAAGFHMYHANMGTGIVIALTIVCAIFLAVFIITERKKKGLTATDFGLTPSGYDQNAPLGAKAKAIGGMILRSAALAAVVIAIGWMYLQLQEDVLGLDFYAWFFGVKDIPLGKIPYYLPYLAVFIVCFVVLFIDMNVERHFPTTGSENKDMIIAMIVNTVLGVAMIAIIVAVKWHLQTIGDPADEGWLWSMGLDTQRIWGMPVGMTVACAGSTFIYRKTGNIWLCALLIGTIACLMGVLYGQYSAPVA